MDDTGSAPFRSKNEGLEDVVSFNSIEVIESLPSDQLQTGTNLYEAVIRPLAYPLDPPVFVRHHSIRTADGLHDLLREISAEAVAKHRSPILHFEAHGNADGLLFEAATLDEVWPRQTSYGPYYWVDDDALQDDVKPIDSLGRR